jgi:SET domain-containing protein
MNGFAYNRDGILIQLKENSIYECNDRCSCNVKLCSNRVVGKGIKLPLQVFKCEAANKGWGVRCAEVISAGTFISEYVGEILLDSDVDKRGK